MEYLKTMKCPDCENDPEVIDSESCIVCNGFGKLCDICADPTNDYHADTCDRCHEKQLNLRLETP